MLGLFRSSSNNFRLVLKFYGISLAIFSYQKLLYLNTRVPVQTLAKDWGEKGESYFYCATEK